MFFSLRIVKTRNRPVVRLESGRTRVAGETRTGHLNYKERDYEVRARVGSLTRKKQRDGPSEKGVRRRHDRGSKGSHELFLSGRGLRLPNELRSV